MVIDPEQIPADGQTGAEISVLVLCETADGMVPIPDMWITVASSRNQFGNELDIIEQPTGPTDADGRAVAYLWSSTPGEAQFIALFGRSPGDGAPLCSSWENSECVELTVMVTFVE
jgi:hypothetical protein